MKYAKNAINAADATDRSCFCVNFVRCVAYVACVA